MRKSSKNQLKLKSETLRSLSTELDMIVGGKPGNTSVGGPCISLDGTTSCCSIYSKCATLCCL